MSKLNDQDEPSLTLLAVARELNITPLSLRGALRVLKIIPIEGRSQGNRMALLITKKQVEQLRKALD